MAFHLYSPSGRIPSSKYAPEKVRPPPGWAIILAEPHDERLAGGLLVKPTEVVEERVNEGAGRIIRITHNKKTEAMQVLQGDRVFYRGFLKYANPIETDDKWLQPEWAVGQKKVYFIVNVDDLCGILDEKVQVGVYSGSISNNEKKHLHQPTSFKGVKPKKG